MNIAVRGFAEVVKSALRPSLATIPQRESTTPHAYKNRQEPGSCHMMGQRGLALKQARTSVSSQVGLCSYPYRHERTSLHLVSVGVVHVSEAGS